MDTAPFPKEVMGKNKLKASRLKWFFLIHKIEIAQANSGSLILLLHIEFNSSMLISVSILTCN